MSSRKTLYAIAIACIIIGAAALLIVRLHEVSPTETSDIVSVATTSSSGMAVDATTTTLAVSGAVSNPPASASSAAPAMRFEVVTTPTAQAQGLGGRANIPDNYAMLFVFPANSSPGFWMKDMLVPIDMIWVNGAGTIVSINASVLPSTYPESFYSPTPIHYVLETKAGFAQEHGWVVGTHVTLPSPYGQ